MEDEDTGIAQNSELGTSLLEIAQSLFAHERTLILIAMALLKKKSEERTDKIKF